MHVSASIDEHLSRTVDVDVVLVVKLEEPGIVGILSGNNLHGSGLLVGQRVVGVQILLGTYAVDVEVVLVVDEGHLLVGIVLVRILRRTHCLVGKHPRTADIGHHVSLLIAQLREVGHVDRRYVVGVVLHDDGKPFHHQIATNHLKRSALSIDVGCSDARACRVNGILRAIF